MSVPHNFCSSSVVVAALVLFILPANLSAQSPAESAQERTARAIQLYHQGNFAQAAELLNSVVKVDADNSDAWCYLGFSLNDDGRIGSAQPAFEQCVRL